MQRTRLSRNLSLLVSLALLGCDSLTGTVELGDNIIPPDLQLDEDFFFCEIQPNVLAPQGCAGGGSGEAGMCHADRSALRLSLAAETALAPDCVDGIPVGPVPPSYQDNLEAVRFTVSSDVTTSPLYRRPTGLDSHPRVIFSETDMEANLIAAWIAAGAT